MQRLTERGIRLAARLRELGFPVIESYPGAAQDILGIPRKGAGEEWLKLGLSEFGIRGEYVTKRVRHDELDAITSALVGSFFLTGKYEALSGESEGSLILPDLKASLGPPVIGISGRIASGKTTAARILEHLGFAYARFSEVIDDEILREGGVPNRSTRQEVGYQLHLDRGQRWLAERVVARASDAQPLTIDGLRWPEDVTFYRERFGGRFLHVHVVANFERRAQRYSAAHDDNLDFADIDAQSAESMIDQVGAQADLQIDNDSTIEAFKEAVRRVGEKALTDWRATCRSPSS
jgi:dephospho-CoA kinase